MRPERKGPDCVGTTSQALGHGFAPLDYPRRISCRLERPKHVVWECDRRIDASFRWTSPEYFRQHRLNRRSSKYRQCGASSHGSHCCWRSDRWLSNSSQRSPIRPRRQCRDVQQTAPTQRDRSSEQRQSPQAANRPGNSQSYNSRSGCQFIAGRLCSAFSSCTHQKSRSSKQSQANSCQQFSHRQTFWPYEQQDQGWRSSRSACSCW